MKKNKNISVGLKILLLWLVAGNVVGNGFKLIDVALIKEFFPLQFVQKLILKLKVKIICFVESSGLKMAISEEHSLRKLLLLLLLRFFSTIVSPYQRTFYMFALKIARLDQTSAGIRTQINRVEPSQWTF